MSKQPYTLAKIKQAINKSIIRNNAEFIQEFSSPYNVLGAVVYGSYAKQKQRADSDLDLFYLTRRAEKRKTCSKHLTSQLSKQLKLEIDSFFSPVQIKKKKRILELLFHPDNLVHGKFVICTPYPKVEKAIREYIANNSN